MKVAHLREINGPAGAPWRLAVALDRGSGGLPDISPPAPSRWLDLEPARRRIVAGDPGRAHNSSLFRQPIGTLDDVLQRGLRIEALAELLEGFVSSVPALDDDDAVLERADLAFGPPILRPPAFRDF